MRSVVRLTAFNEFDHDACWRGYARVGADTRNPRVVRTALKACSAAGRDTLPSVCFTTTFIPHSRRDLHTTSCPAAHQRWCHQSRLYSGTIMTACYLRVPFVMTRLPDRNATFISHPAFMRSVIRFSLCVSDMCI